ncbi:MAG: Hsp20/alpha crystallin family protein [Candidatus Tectomicrobia bacterium]|uniref:Hsp20/alpha crystallin family protein n=1 Tax=Tectimicrobiota bacterium TaxID=2528274 RepID=A0A932GN38_UNCTE|nr:Hsp20/alpha crystallin family protein [Candidatus Tectomicrobia bacterium]
MSSSQWDPLHDLLALKDRMNALFNETFSHTQGRPQSPEGTWSPALDIYETPEEYVLTAELPGIPQEDIDLQILDDVLTLQGHRNPDVQPGEKQENYLRRERPNGRFRRSFTLPSTVDAGKTRATLKDGILKVILPKAPQTKPKSIRVSME